jgi:hypothetical protein
VSRGGPAARAAPCQGWVSAPDAVVGDREGGASARTADADGDGDRGCPCVLGYVRDRFARLEHVIDEVAPVLGFRPSVRTEGPVDSSIPEGIAHDLLAVLREALSNTARHANAGAVNVRLAVSEQITLEVHDDGRGVGTPTRASGLANMATRAPTPGGHCAAPAAPGRATTVRWVVPLPMPITPGMPYGG